MRSRLNWVIVRVPLDVAKVWGSRGQLKVRGDINGFAFRTSLFPTGKGDHLLLVNKQMQAGGKVKPGMAARFRLEPDTEERHIVLPAELREALAEERAVLRWFEKLNYSMRKYLVDLVAGVKSAEARQRRAGHLAETLLAAMEGEHDPPPVLRLALSRDARAWEGWNRMTEIRRRGHLLGIFYYRNPASQARRAAKAAKDAIALVEKAEDPET
jgi:hypothetical protein